MSDSDDPRENGSRRQIEFVWNQGPSTVALLVNFQRAATVGERHRRSRQPVGVPQSDLGLGLGLGLGEGALVLEEARRARQSFGGMADDGLAVLHRDHRGHRNLTPGCPG